MTKETKEEKTYQVNFYSFNSIVKADSEEEAEKQALTQLYDGELSIEIESIKEIEE